MNTQESRHYGVIDIGTIKIKCQIVEKEPSGIVKTVYQSNNLTCLGCGMKQNGNRPLKSKLQKTISELKRCKKMFEKYKVVKSRIVSTHALREMGEVGKDIAKSIEEKVGVKVEIIKQKEEAKLFFNAVLSDFDEGREYVVADIGGGSVQILIGSKYNLKHVFLLKTGSSSLWDEFTPNHTGTDFPNTDEIKAMREHIKSKIEPIPGNIKTPIIYGSSCIIDSFKGISIPMQQHKFSRSHPYKVKVSDMSKFLEGIWPISYEDREKKYVSPTEGYMWGIDKAFLNIIELAKKVKAPYVIPSNANINQGLLVSIIK
jgi:exopolyphosphatase/guanosine-5'-triphosphate,3'-diphosphate pyrophosphatase